MNLNLRLIKSDIEIAKMCISPIRNLFNDELFYSSAAYHAEQATEKCLKVILNQYYGISDTTKRYRTHDIPDLLAYIDECEKNQGKVVPISIPQVIDDNSIIIKSWEANSRYNDNMKVLRRDILDVIKACETMYRDLQKNGFF